MSEDIPAKEAPGAQAHNNSPIGIIGFVLSLVGIFVPPLILLAFPAGILAVFQKQYSFGVITMIISGVTLLFYLAIGVTWGSFFGRLFSFFS